MDFVTMPQTEGLTGGDREDSIYRNFDIKHLFGKENLENIQSKIAKATGLAFVTVDYKGEPVTELTSFTAFCQSVRQNKEEEKICRSSDAFGAIQAAVTQKTSVYFCPCGLLEVAIPIIVRGHYLGGFIGGQIRCLDAPDSVCQLGVVMHHEEDYRTAKKDLYNEIRVLEYQQFVNVADLVSMIINQLGEKELSRLMQKEISGRAMDRFREKEKKMQVEFSRKDAELDALRSLMDPSFLLRNLNAVSNLALIEDAPRTNEMVNLFSDFVRSTIAHAGGAVTLAEEAENIERYLKIQKIRLGDRLRYSIQLPERYQMQYIPGGLLFPFIEKSIFCSIGLAPEGGALNLSVSVRDGRVLVRISDTGAGLSNEEIFKRLQSYRNSGFEEAEIEAGISSVKHRLAAFGPDYGVAVETGPDGGSICTVTYPQNFDEFTEKVM